MNRRWMGLAPGTWLDSIASSGAGDLPSPTIVRVDVP